MLALAMLTLASVPAWARAQAPAADTAPEPAQAPVADTTPEPAPEAPPPIRNPDPWEPFNRFIHRMNETGDIYFVKPLAQGWDFLTPSPFQTVVTNFNNNLQMPVILGNNLLQLKPRHVGDDFLRLLADRVYKHLYNGGAMSDAEMQARYTAITNTIRDAVVGESARWGDTLEPEGEPTYTRDVQWQNAVNVHLGLMAGRADKMIAARREENYYPSIDPPIFNQRGGEVGLPFSLVLTNPNGGGAIRYTLDGTDPADGGSKRRPHSYR